MKAVPLPRIGQVFIAGQFSLPSGAPASRVRHLALGLAAHGVPVRILPAALDAQSPHGDLDEGTGLVTIEPPCADAVPYGRLRNVGLRERLSWAVHEVRRFRQLYARFSEANVRPGDVLVLYGRSYLRLAPLFWRARRANATVVWDIVESAEQLRELIGPRALLRLDTVMGMRLARRADLVTAITTGLSRLYEPFVRVCHLPTLLSWPESSRTTRPSTSGRLELLYVGALVERDAPDLLLDVMRRCVQAGLPVRLTIAGRFGTSPDGREWAARVHEDEGLASSVALIQNPSDEDLRNLRAAADAFVVLRADTTAEALSFPTRVVESLQFAKPVITTDVGDVSLFLADNVSACIARPGSVDDLMRAVEGLLGAESRRMAIGRAGFEVGRAQFDRVKLADRWLKSVAAADAGWRAHA